MFGKISPTAAFDKIIKSEKSLENPKPRRTKISIFRVTYLLGECLLQNVHEQPQHLFFNHLHFIFRSVDNAIYDFVFFSFFQPKYNPTNSHFSFPVFHQVVENYKIYNQSNIFFFISAATKKSTHNSNSSSPKSHTRAPNQAIVLNPECHLF